MTMSSSQNYHQDSEAAINCQINWSSVPPTSACPCRSTWTTMMWLWRTLPDIFFTNLVRSGHMLRNWYSCRISEAAESSSGYRETRLWWLGKMGWMQWSVCYTWEKVWIRHYWKCTNWPLTKVTPVCVASLRRITWMSRWNPSKNYQLGKMGAPESGTAEYLFGKPPWETGMRTAFGRLPVATAVISLVTKAVHARWGNLSLFCELQQIIYLCSFICIISPNKVI